MRTRVPDPGQRHLRLVPAHLDPGGPSFVAVDVETANPRRGSICAIGATVVRNGVIGASHSWLTRPPAGLDHFFGFNTALHGITPEMVVGAPAFEARLEQLVNVADGLPLVAHNAAFDIGALREACEAVGREWSSFDYACSLVMSRRALNLISYRLPVVAAECGVKPGEHHDAGSDSLVCAEIVLELARRRDADNLEDLLADLQVLRGRVDANVWRGCQRAPTCSSLPPEAAADADPAHPLYGQVMVFTGALSLVRSEAWEAVAACGATVEKDVTKRTTMLVVGDGFLGHDPADFYTGKAMKAVRWRDKGVHIEVLTEGDLSELLAERHMSGIRSTVPA